MSLVTIGTSLISPTDVVFIYYDDVTFEASSAVYATSSLPYPTGGWPTYEEGQTLTAVCNGTTKYEYSFTTFSPYYEVEIESNSYYCEFNPPVCDLTFPNPAVTTDETSEGANDGTATVFATGTGGFVTYYLDGYGTSGGYFLDLAPGDYTVTAEDAKGCTATISFTINPFIVPSGTRYKYRLKFTTVLTGIEYELKFLDQKNFYDEEIYPLDLTGTDSPLMPKTTNSNEDKTEVICPSSLRINLLYDGETFSITEFALAAERDWKIELYRNGELDWQGWLLPDEIQDLYADPQYPIQLIATDGLLSLKGATFSDLSIYNTYSDGIRTYSPIFGIRKWVYLLRICLEQLGYDYGETTLVSSLTYQSYNANQWLNYSTWADVFYDENDNPVSVYDALVILLGSLHLQIFQHKGKFQIRDINDLYYRNSGILATQFSQSVIKFNKAFTTVTTGVAPDNSVVGYNKINRPINPQQTLNYDKAYNRLEAKIDFSLLSLLYENPSFEINSVVGELPEGFQDLHGGISQKGLIDTDAYDGKWSLQVGWNTSLTYPESIDHFFETEAPFYSVDQPNKSAKVSFMWKPSPDNFDFIDGMWGVTFSFAIVFIDGTSGNGYFLKTPDFKPYNILQWSDGSDTTDFNSVTENTWQGLDGGYTFDYWDGDAVAIKGFPTTDYTGWQSFSIDTGAFPESGIGKLLLRFYGAAFIPFQPLQTVPIPFTGKGNFFFYTNNVGYYRIDNLNITLSDAVNPYNRQIGESHVIKNVTEYAKAEKKQVDLKLFTYPNNKRIAGNFMYGDVYDTASLSNEWLFRLSPDLTPARLPTNVLKRIARNYQRPMFKWQGDILSDVINYNMIFTIEGLDGRMFIPFTIEMDLRNSVGNIVLIEIDDTATQDGYTYSPLFEKSARNNLT